MIWIVISVVICLVDLCIKHYIEKHVEKNEYRPILKNKIIITKFYNTGAMLGWLRERSKLLLGITVLGVGILTFGLGESIRYKQSPLIKLGLSMLLGGAASNAWDRLQKHQVTDYFRISIGSKRLERIIFNLGDMAIFAGSILFLLGEIGEE